MMDNELSQHFLALGFTALESDIYCFLLENGLSTGYSIAKGINKPAANVYKALETLSQKGGVASSNSAKKSFNAVHWRELLERQKKQFDQHLDSLSEKLQSIDKQVIDEQVYQIDNQAQVAESTIKLIGNANSFVLADIEPDALPLFADAFEQAAKRGVEVRIKAYQPVALSDVHVSLRQHGPDIHDKSSDVSFSICADGKEFVAAVLTKDTKKVIQAFRSHSALMNVIVHNYCLYGQVLTELKQHLNNNDLSQAKQVLSDTEHLHPLSQENLVFQHFKDSYNV